MSWFNSKGYRQGMFFLILMMCVSCTNDVITKFLGQRLPPMEVMFFRFFFNLVTLLPLIIKEGFGILKTKMLAFNIYRGILGVLAFALFIFSIINIKLIEVIIVCWAIPIFVLPLSAIFLKENVTILRWVATIIGFVGLSCISLIGSDYNFSFKMIYLVPIASAFIFAVQDVMIKKMVESENKLTMLFYFAAVATVISLFPAIYVWQSPTIFELCMLFLIGAGGNIMQYFLFKAYNATDLSALSPLRYLEFFIAAIFGFTFFGEIPGLNVFITALVLIPATLYLSMSESRK